MSIQEEELKRDIAKIIYEAFPMEESGEYVDGFQVSPEGELTWKQLLECDDQSAAASVRNGCLEAADRVITLISHSWVP